ncbi:potassium channel protein [Hymenobacter tenuis]
MPHQYPNQSSLRHYLHHMWYRFNLTRFVGAVILSVLSVMVGTVGFMWIEKFTLVEAFYMTMITVSTVGFGEVHPLSSSGQLFVSVYIFLNLIMFAYLLSVLTTYIFDGGLRKMFTMLRNDQEIHALSNHIIVCGFGRNGRKAYHDLRASGADVVVVEQNEELLKEAVEATGERIPVVFGDATLDETLRAAGVERASALITALPKDADNVFVTLTARELCPKITIIARASLKSSEPKLLRAGANSVVMPDEIGGSHMANLITRPEVIRFLDMISGLGPNKLRLEELSSRELRPEWRKRSLRELDIRTRTGATVIGMKHATGNFTVNPTEDTVPAPGDILLFLGTDAQITSLLAQFQLPG